MKRNVREEFLKFIENVIKREKEGRRVAILVSLLRKYEGVCRVVEQQVEELSRNDYQVSIYTFETNVRLRNNSVKVRLIRPFIPKLYAWIYRALFFLDIISLVSLVNELKHFNLIIIHHGNMAVLGFILKKLFKTKVIFWNHHIEYTHIASPLKYKVYETIFGTINWKIIKKFDYVVSVSHFSRYQLKALKGIDSIVIYNRIDERFREGLDGSPVRKKYGLGKEPVLLFVGRLVPSKNVHLLIEVLNMVKKEVPNVKLIIVGRRDDKDYYNKLLKIADSSVIFEENVSDEELPLYYAACDIYVTCSELEGFNLPLAEAQACGKPVVAFDIGPHREIVKRGYLVKPFDIIQFKEAILKLLRERYLGR